MMERLLTLIAMGGDGGSAFAPLRVFGAVVLVVSIALLVTSRRLRRPQRIPAVAALIAGGWAMVAVGMGLGPYATGLLSQDEVGLLHPLLVVLLGWIGMLVGLQANRDLIRTVPAGVLWLAITDAVLSVALIGGAALALLVWLDAEHRVLTALPAAAVIAASAVGWSPEIRSLGREESADSQTAMVMRGTSGIGAMLAIMIFGVSAFSLTGGETPEHPSILETFGRAGAIMIFLLTLAVMVGMMGRWLMQLAGRGEGEFLVVLLGIISFGAGAAITLGYSPILLAMLMGIVIVNLPGWELSRFQRVLVRAEQPVAMMLMLAVGIMIDLRLGLTGLLIAGALVTVRLLVKLLLLGPLVLRVLLPHRPRRMLLGMVRQSPLGLALAVGYAVSPIEHSGPLTAANLLTVIAMVGLICEILPLLTRFVPATRDSV